MVEILVAPIRASALSFGGNRKALAHELLSLSSFLLSNSQLVIDGRLAHCFKHALLFPAWPAIALALALCVHVHPSTPDLFWCGLSVTGLRVESKSLLILYACVTHEPPSFGDHWFINWI